MASELMAAINSYLLGKLAKLGDENIFVPTNINEDFFAGDSEQELMCRHDVGPLVVKRWLTGAYKARFNFSYYMASPNVLTSRRTLEEIEKCLAIDNFVGLFGLQSGRIMVVTRPTPVSRDESGISIYTSSYRLEFEEEQNE